MLVLPEDDDGAEIGGGPPPDPSMREWRHPSEIAAAAAAAARAPEIPRDRPLRSMLGTIGGTAFGVITLVGLALYLTGTANRGTTIEVAPVPTGETAGPFSSARAGSFGQTESDADLARDVTDETTSVQTDTGADATANDGQVETTPEPAPGTTVLAPEVSVSTMPPTALELAPDESLLAADLLPEDTDAIDGVFGLTDEGLGRLGGFLAADGLVYTSANAIGDHQRFALRQNDEWFEATLLGADPSSDVAVLQPVEVDGPVVLADTGVRSAANEVVVSLAGMEIALVIPGLDQTETLTGNVLGDEKAITTGDGTFVYGAMQTSVREPAGSPGSGLYNGENLLVGMIIDSTDYLTTAIPIERVVEIGRSFLERGVPAVEWLGISGTTLPDVGGVQVTDVTEGGPAAEAGLVPDDVIVGFDGIVVVSLDHLVYLIRSAGVDTSIGIEILRDGGRHTVETTIGSLPAEATSAGP